MRGSSFSRVGAVLGSLGAVALVAAGAGACSPYSPSLPAQPFLCGSADPVCPDGYTCMANGSGTMICVGGTEPGVDAAGSGSGSCADDSMLEPNEDIQHAYQTPVASSRLTLDLAQLAICPTGDKDTYAFNITVENQNADATITYESGVPLQVSILNAGGASIVNGVSAGMNMVKAHAANLPVGVFYVQVFGPTTGGTNNYELGLAVSGP